MTMKRLMVRAAQWNCEFIADFAPQSSWLSELQVMSVGRVFLTNKTTLAAHKGEVLLAAAPWRLLWEGELGGRLKRHSSTQVAADCTFRQTSGWSLAERRLSVCFLMHMP